MIRRLLFAAAVLWAACAPRQAAVPDHPGATKTVAAARAERRLYDGAPPTIPHAAMGAACASCHTAFGMAVEGLGFAPPSPHEDTRGLSAISRCEQCHVYQTAAAPFRANAFAGLRQDLRHGRRLHDFAPPVIPHKTFMRENCAACHSGPAAREEIRTSHPDRPRCRQCHLEQVTTESFVPARRRGEVGA
jgi:nitrate reductase (cytochrome), electron transfer subunit